MYVLILQLILSEGNHWVYLARQILAFAMHATEPSSKQELHDVLTFSDCTGKGDRWDHFDNIEEVV